MPTKLKTFSDSVVGSKDVISDYDDRISSIGDFRVLKGINALVKSLKNLLLTPLGTYPFDPEYGSELYKKVFELVHSDTKEQIRFEVEDRVLQFDPRIQIENVFVEYYSNLKGFRVSVFIRYDGQTEPIILDYNQTDFYGMG